MEGADKKKDQSSSGLLNFEAAESDSFAFDKPLPPEPAANLIEDFLKAEAGDFNFGRSGDSLKSDDFGKFDLPKNEDFGKFDESKSDDFGKFDVNKFDDFSKFEATDDFGKFDSPKKSDIGFASKSGGKEVFDDFLEDARGGGIGESPPLTPRPDYEISKTPTKSVSPEPAYDMSTLPREPFPLPKEPTPPPKEPSPPPKEPTPPAKEPTPPPKEPTPPPKEPTPPPKEPTPPPKEPTPPPKEPTPPPKEPTPEREPSPVQEREPSPVPWEPIPDKPLAFNEESSFPPPLKPKEEVKPAPMLPPRERPASASEIAPKDLFGNIGLDAWFNPGRLHPKVESLVYWRDVKKSGVVFGVTLACLLSLVYCSLISVVSYLCLLSLFATVSFRIYKNVMQAVQKTSDGHPFKELLEVDIEIKEDKAKEATSAVVAHLNSWFNELRRLFLVVDLVDSLKFGVCLWALTYVGALFNGLSLIILCWIALFSLPKVYENNKQQIDASLELANAKISEITNKVKAALPGKKEEKKDQ